MYDVSGLVSLKHSFGLLHNTEGTMYIEYRYTCMCMCVCVHLTAKEVAMCVYKQYTSAKKRSITHHKSPSLELRNIHSSLDWGSEVTRSARALPTRPVPPVTRTWRIYGEYPVTHTGRPGACSLLSSQQCSAAWMPEGRLSPP